MLKFRFGALDFRSRESFSSNYEFCLNKVWTATVQAHCTSTEDLAGVSLGIVFKSLAECR